MPSSSSRPKLQLLEPSLEMLSAYAEALGRGWSPNNVENVSAAQLAEIGRDPAGFIAELLRQGGTFRLPDGTLVPKLPDRPRWMWDGGFAGHIGLRWQPGTDALPAHVLGHIGYAVVPWKRCRGYATEALRLMLIQARWVGLRAPRFGPGVRLRYCIDLVDDAASEEKRS